MSSILTLPQPCTTQLPLPATVFLNGSQRLMLYWERFAPVNACHVAELGPTCPINSAQVELSFSRVLTELGIGDVSADQWSQHYTIEPTSKTYEVTIVKVNGEFDRALENLIHSEFHRPFANNSCPLRCLWVEESVPSHDSHSPARPLRRAIIIVYRHSIADSRSIRFIMKRVLSQCLGEPDEGMLQIYAGSLWSDLRHGSRPVTWGGFASHIARELYRMSRCVLPRLATRKTLDRCVVRIHADEVSTDQTLETASRLGVKFQDLIFAAALEALQLEPGGVRSSWRRRRLALQCPVDLRRYLPATDGCLFGQLLGTLQIDHSSVLPNSFRELAQRVHQQTREQKQRNSAAYYPAGMSIFSCIHRNLPGSSGFVAGRSIFPIMGGISNSNLSVEFEREAAKGTIVRYSRATHLGHVLPMMLFVSSFGGHVRFESTRRESFLDDAAMERIIHHIIRRCRGE